jgi:hypothetical protein
MAIDLHLQISGPGSWKKSLRTHDTHRLPCPPACNGAMIAYCDCTWFTTIVSGLGFSNFEQSAIVYIMNSKSTTPRSTHTTPQSIVTPSDFTLIRNPHQVQNPNAAALLYSSVLFRQNPRLLSLAIHQILRPKVKVTAGLEQPA